MYKHTFMSIKFTPWLNHVILLKFHANLLRSFIKFLFCVNMLILPITYLQLIKRRGLFFLIRWRYKFVQLGNWEFITKTIYSCLILWPVLHKSVLVSFSDILLKKLNTDVGLEVIYDFSSCCELLDCCSLLLICYINKPLLTFHS